MGMTFALFLACGCGRESAVDDAIREVSQRQNIFSDYPQPGKTYLSYSTFHGYQVNYLSANDAWLWYPGNAIGVREKWRADKNKLCWRTLQITYNPASGKRSNAWQCESLSIAQKTVVSELKGDPFGLSSGSIPFVLDRCKPPEKFLVDARSDCFGS